MRLVKLKNSPLVRRFNKMHKNLRAAILLTLAVCLWMLTGIFSATEKPENKTERHTEQSTVTVQTMEAEPYTETVVLYGTSQAQVQAKVSARTQGTITKLNKDVGDTVKAGEVLLTIDIATRKADLKAAEAELARAQKLYDAAVQLNKEGFKSDVTVAERAAQLATAEQTVATIRQDIAYTTVKSPVSGRVEARSVSKGDLVSVGTHLFTVVGQEKYLLVAYASQAEQAQIETGRVATATLANGQQVEGVVRFVSRLGEEETHTYRVEAEVDGKAFTMPVGMTATINIPVEETTAHLVPHSALVLNEEGNMGVRYVENGVVQFAPVSNFNDTPEGFYFTGLPNPAQIIIRGQNTVSKGETVTTIEQED